MCLVISLMIKIKRPKMSLKSHCCLTLLIHQSLSSQIKENQNTDCLNQLHQTTFKMKIFLMVQSKKLETSKSSNSQQKRLPLCLNLKFNQKRHTMSGLSSNLQTRRKLPTEQLICYYPREIQFRCPDAHEGLQKP